MIEPPRPIDLHLFDGTTLTPAASQNHRERIPVAACRGRRSAHARRPEIWIAISLTKSVGRRIFGASELLLLEPKARRDETD